MPLKSFAATFLLTIAALAAPAPLPELRIEPTGGGSIFYVKNPSSQPLTAYLIELVDYPGSSYSFWRDDPSAPIAPAAETRTKVANMTVGAVPDYVKMRAALYADGSTAGIPEKVAQLVERHRFLQEKTSELIARLEKSQDSKQDLKEWSDSMPAPSRADRNSQAGINYAAAKSLISETLSALGTKSQAEVLASLRARTAH